MHLLLPLVGTCTLFQQSLTAHKGHLVEYFLPQKEMQLLSVHVGQCMEKHPCIYRKVIRDKDKKLDTGLFVPKLLEWCEVQWNKN